MFECIVFLFSRLSGYPIDNLHTCGLVTGMINSGSSLGAAVGPIIGGAIMDALDFAWMGTALAAVNFMMVGSSGCIVFFMTTFVWFQRTWFF